MSQALLFVNLACDRFGRKLKFILLIVNLRMATKMAKLRVSQINQPQKKTVQPRFQFPSLRGKKRFYLKKKISLRFYLKVGSFYILWLALTI